MIGYSMKISALLAAVSLVVIPAAKAELVYGLATSNNTDYLFTFDSATPGVVLTGSPVTGLPTGVSLVGIDFRPSNGLLYGVGSNSQLYTVSAAGATTFIANLATPLNGTSFDIDTNPVANALRIVSDAGQNLAIDFSTGANLAAVQSPINAGSNYPVGSLSPIISGTAYTNNFAGATTTVQYTIDSQNDFLNTQTSPASGTQVFVTTLKDNTGAPVNVTTLLGFDISGVTGTAYVGLQQSGNGFSQFSALDLATGRLTGVNLLVPNSGQIGGGLFLRDLSVAVPEPTTLATFGLAVAGLVARRRRA